MLPIEIIKNKILYDWDLIPSIVKPWIDRGERTVFTNGCFDIIHRGHIELLSQAASLGDHLVIGLNSDASVKRLKGPSRPVQDEASRALILAAFGFTSLVIIFSGDTPLELIELLKPRVLVKGGDYKAEEIVGYEQVIKNNGAVHIIPFIEGYSTSGIVKKLLP